MITPRIFRGESEREREFRAVKKAMFPPALLPMRKVFEKST